MSLPCPSQHPTPQPSELHATESAAPPARHALSSPPPPLPSYPYLISTHPSMLSSKSPPQQNPAPLPWAHTDMECTPARLPLGHCVQGVHSPNHWGQPPVMSSSTGPSSQHFSHRLPSPPSSTSPASGLVGRFYDSFNSYFKTNFIF